MSFDIRITDKIATAIDAPEIICGNADYEINFVFDAEWEEYEIKTAVFTYRRKGQTKYKEVVFVGTKCNVPVLSGIDEVNVGVYAGDLHTTTPAKLQCKKSALCDIAKIDDTPLSVYNQLLELLKNYFPIEAGVRANEAADAAEQYVETAKQELEIFKSDVNKEIEDIINFAPETLDTLAEIAEALNNDPNFATTIMQHIASIKNELNGSIANNKADAESKIDKKVDKVAGKGLSTNDFTTADKNKLDSSLTEQQIAALISGSVIWENPNPSQAYNTENGTVNAAIYFQYGAYARFKIIYKSQASDENNIVHIAEVNCVHKDYVELVVVSDYLKCVKRKIQIRNTQGYPALEVYDAIGYSDTQQTAITTNDWCIPLKIIGYKY